ncbi:MAG: EamA family transporter [Gemmataceae bacterium]
MIDSSSRSPTWLVIFAFTAIYIIWGSTYLAIRWAIEGLPPFFMAGSRFMIAGLLLGSWLVARGQRLPTPRQWRSAFCIGLLMLVIANGGVSWAEQYVPSGLVALFSALAPMWMVGFDMIIPNHDGVRGKRPSARLIAGLVLGSAGMVLLVSGQSGDFTGLGEGPMPKLAASVLLCATLAWTSGSLLTRRLDRPKSTFMATSAQMVTGGAVLLVFAALRGELGEISPAKLTWISLLSHLYLIVFGSIVALTAYTWLLENVSPSRVATYGYVNPVVAIILGWALGGETLNGSAALATILIVLSVAMIVTPAKNDNALEPITSDEDEVPVMIVKAK